MIILRDRSQIPDKIDELKSLHPNKKEALARVDSQIIHLEHIARYRYTTEPDFETGVKLALHRTLRQYLDLEIDWEVPEPEKAKPQMSERILNAIKYLPINLIYYSISKFPKLFKTIQVKVNNKRELLKKKNLI